MNPTLRSDDYELKDLAIGEPMLLEASDSRSTGIRLLSCLGAGGNSTVFLAERTDAPLPDYLSPHTPRRLAIKLMHPRSARSLQKSGIDPISVFARESVALGRMMERRPPCEFVVGYFGSGTTRVSIASEIHQLPWLALEFIDGGRAGASISKRVRRCPSGVDPIRALRLVTGIIEGVRALHEEGVLHRDLKPDNVLITGPVDNEAVKLVDCGIARIQGFSHTVQGMTVTYGGPEQTLTRPGESCPVIGPWTDVHALAATVWFVLGGEDWCRGAEDIEWFRGKRRSLLTAVQLHPAFKENADLTAEVDRALIKGAAQRLPDEAWVEAGADSYKVAAQALLPGMFRDTVRAKTVDEFRQQIVPALSRVCERWIATATQSKVAATEFRPMMVVQTESTASEQHLAVVQPFAAMNVADVPRSEWLDPILAGGTSSFAFLPDGKVLARFHDRLFYVDFVDGMPQSYAIGHPHKKAVAQAKWTVRGPSGGFALIGPSHILLLSAGRFRSMPLPDRAGGGAVGTIATVIRDGARFGIATHATTDSMGHPELWTSADGLDWYGPFSIPLGGTPRSLSFGPFGFFAVGAGRDGRARAVHVGLDGRARAASTDLHRQPPLSAAVCGTGTMSWAAGEGFVVAIDGESVAPEEVEHRDRPIMMKLDLVGVPWLLTEHAVLRRHIEEGRPYWKVYHRIDEGQPALEAFGFTPSGCCVFDRFGDGVFIKPFDVEEWSQVETYVRESPASTEA